MKSSLVYFENGSLGYLENNNVKKFDNDSLNDYVFKLEKEIKKCDSNRNNFSIILGILCLVITLTLGILDLVHVIKIGLFNFTIVIALAILVWELLYYICGFIFYKKINIDYHFKSAKSVNPNVLMAYNSTEYSKYMDKYVDNKNMSTLYHPITKKLVTLGLFNKLRVSDRFIFNGRIITNICYYYLSYKSTRIIFLPGIVIYIDKKNSKVCLNTHFNYTYNDNIIRISLNGVEVLEFKSDEKFNVNLFNFKY